MGNPRIRAAAAAIAVVVLAGVGRSRAGAVPLLSLADLGFHELGHFLTYWAPDLVTAVMGSVAQVAVPFGLACYFALVRRELPSAAVCLAWAGTSAWGVARYVADAPFERLQLIGGDHDWAFLLTELGRIDDAAGLAGAVRGFGWAAIASALTLCVHSWRVGTTGPADVASDVAGAQPTRRFSV